MELRQLRYFVGVARELNFTRAASKLRVAQPALSRQIRQLEEEVGSPLFERGARGVRLTPAGEAFLTDAEALLQQSELAVRSAQLRGQRQQGQLKVGYVWALFHTLVPEWVARFRKANPGVAVHLFDQTATQQAEALAQGRLDLGFIGFAFEADAARLRKRRVGACAFMAALPVGHPAARKRRVSLGSLSDERFIVISEETYPGAAHYLKEACREAGFRPKILQTAERGFTILGLVAANCGVTLLPESLQVLPHPGVVFRPLQDPPAGDLFIAWRPASKSLLAQAFLATLPTD
jgi:DNA-binding transcriptional LysR family regulator